MVESTSFPCKAVGNPHCLGACSRILASSGFHMNLVSHWTSWGWKSFISKMMIMKRATQSCGNTRKTSADYTARVSGMGLLWPQTHNNSIHIKLFLSVVPVVMRAQLYTARRQGMQHAPKEGEMLPTFDTYLDTEQSSRHKKQTQWEFIDQGFWKETCFSEVELARGSLP